MPSLPCCMCTIVVCGLLDLASLFCVTEPAACRHTCCSPPDLTHACCVWAPPALQEHSRFVYDEQLTWRKLGHLLLIPTNVMVIFQVRAESYRSVNLGPSRKPAAMPDCKNCRVCAPAQPGMGCPAARPLSLHPPPPPVELCVQGLFGCLPWGMILTYLNDFLSQNKGLSVQAATMVRRRCRAPHHAAVCACHACHCSQVENSLPLTLITAHAWVVVAGCRSCWLWASAALWGWWAAAGWARHSTTGASGA
jgi:hypothetical protein